MLLPQIIELHEKLLSLAEKIASKISANSPNAIGAAMRAINANYKDGVNGYQIEIEEFGKCFGTAEFKEGTGARIEIKANQALVYRSYLMPGLEKWVVDLPGAITTFVGDESKKIRTAPLERITVRQTEVNGDHLTRIGFDFKGEVDFSLKEDLLDKGHLIVIIKPSRSAQQKGAAGTSATTAAKTLSGLK